jgi:hypothetical protein
MFYIGTKLQFFSLSIQHFYKLMWNLVCKCFISFYWCDSHYRSAITILSLNYPFQVWLTYASFVSPLMSQSWNQEISVTFLMFPNTFNKTLSYKYFNNVFDLFQGLLHNKTCYFCFYMYKLSCNFKFYEVTTDIILYVKTYIHYYTNDLRCIAQPLMEAAERSWWLEGGE